VARPRGRFQNFPRPTLKKYILFGMLAGDCSVQSRAAELARLCGMKAPWKNERTISLPNVDHRFESVIYELRISTFCPHLLDEEIGRFFPTDEGFVWCCRTILKRGSRMVSARTKTVEIMERGEDLAGIRIPEMLRKLTSPAKYHFQRWCLSCARKRASEQGGNIDWLIGAES